MNFVSKIITVYARQYFKLLCFPITILFFISNPSCQFKNRSFTSPKNTVNIAWEGPPRTADPRFAQDANSQYLEALLHCSLFAPDQQGLIKPQLVKNWHWAHPKKLILRIHQDARFADGSRVTITDIKSTFDFFMQKDIPSPRAGHFKSLKSIETVAPDQLVFSLHAPDGGFLVNLTLGILPQRWARGPHISFQQSVGGCGAYIIQSHNLNSIILSPNPLGLPQKNSSKHNIQIHFVKDEITRFSKLRKGELDLVQNIISYDKIDLIAKKYPQLKIQRQKGLKIAYIGFNFKNKYLADLKVRQAISQAIHRSEIVKYILKNNATLAKTILLPSSPFYQPSLPQLKYDPNLAQQILDDAGYPRSKETGMRFDLNFKTTTNATRIAVAQAVANDLGRIGIKVKIQTLEWGKFKADVEKGLVDMWTLHWIGFKDPNIYHYIFGSENAPPNGGNRGFYTNTKLDKWLHLGRVAVDPKLRQQSFFKVQDIIAQDLPYVFLWHEDQLAIMNRKIHGYKVYADGRYTALQDIEIKN